MQLSRKLPYTTTKYCKPQTADFSQKRKKKEQNIQQNKINIYPTEFIANLYSIHFFYSIFFLFLFLPFAFGFISFADSHSFVRHIDQLFFVQIFWIIGLAAACLDPCATHSHTVAPFRYPSNGSNGNTPPKNKNTNFALSKKHFC